MNVRFSMALTVAVAAFVAAIGSTGCSEAPAPADPDARLVASVCTGCHDLARVRKVRGISRAQWDVLVKRMESHGAVMSEAERERVLDYLAGNGPL